MSKNKRDVGWAILRFSVSIAITILFWIVFSTAICIISSVTIQELLRIMSAIVGDPINSSAGVAGVIIGLFALISGLSGSLRSINRSIEETFNKVYEDFEKVDGNE